MASKKEIEAMKKIVSEEALTCYLDHDAEYEFHNFDNEVQTLYVWQSRDTVNPVEFVMLKPLERRIAKINPRYRVGIMFEDQTGGLPLDE
tara:strand:- start:352 stop:621 length:270 start_codon:yes stop_codon:yes gene_type:complete